MIWKTRRRVVALERAVENLNVQIERIERDLIESVTDLQQEVALIRASFERGLWS